MTDFNPGNPSISQADNVFNQAIGDLRAGNLTFERAFSLAKMLPSGTGFVYQFFGSVSAGVAGNASKGYFFGSDGSVHSVYIGGVSLALPPGGSAGEYLGLLRGNASDISGLSANREAGLLVGEGTSVPMGAGSERAYELLKGELFDQLGRAPTPGELIFASESKGIMPYSIHGAVAGAELGVSFTAVTDPLTAGEIQEKIDGESGQGTPSVSMELPEEQLTDTKCFAAGTPIEMPDGTMKAIENIKIGDKVLAFDGDMDGGRGAKVPRRVTQLHRTENQPLINFHGTMVTPGHAYLTGEGTFLPIIEILQNDGTVVNADGRVIRARMGWEVGSREDKIIPVGYPDGDEIKLTTMRAGTLYGGKDGKAFTIEHMMNSREYHMTSDGRFIGIEGDIKTAYWEWGMPDDKMIAGKYAEYIDLVEGSSIGIGMPLVPSRPN